MVICVAQVGTFKKKLHAYAGGAHMVLGDNVKLVEQFINAWAQAGFAVFWEYRSKIDDLYFRLLRTRPPGVEWEGCQQDILVQAQYQFQSSPLQLTEPFSLEVQSRDRMADAPSHGAPVLPLHSAVLLPVVMSARLAWHGKAWLDLGQDGITVATTVMQHIEPYTDAVRLHFAGLLPKHQRFQVPVSERVDGDPAYNGMCRSDLTAVKPVSCTRYSLYSCHETLHVLCTAISCM